MKMHKLPLKKYLEGVARTINISYKSYSADVTERKGIVQLVIKKK